MRADPQGRNPLLLPAFLWSVAGSTVVLGLLLVSDSRVLELKRARAEIRELDRRITEGQRENEQLAVAIEAARRHDFPAEREAREELHLVSPEDIVLLYPAGSLTKPESKPGGAPAPTPGPR